MKVRIEDVYMSTRDGSPTIIVTEFSTVTQLTTTGKTISSSAIVDSDHEYLDPPPDVDFSDIAGMYEIRTQLREEIIEPFSDPRFDEYDVSKGNGILFYGPPGTGKTHIATAVAGELGYNFFEVDVSGLRSREFGQTQSNITEVFEIAEANQPCVVLLDELDTIAPTRDSSLHQARAEVVNHLFRRIEAVNEENGDIVIIGTTNREEQIDTAVKRTGRIDTKVEFELPDSETRLAILKQELESFTGSVDPVWDDQAFSDTFVDATGDFTPSDIVEIADSAQRESLRRTTDDEVPHVTSEIILEELDIVAAEQQEATAGQFLAETPEIDFTDVGGMSETKTHLKETFLDPISDPELYERYGLEIPNGVLLYGPPGTGKTYLSKALAGEADYAFLSITASDVVSKWIGEAAQNIQHLFQTATEVAPAIVFIDEIDALANDRDEHMTNSEQQAVNELLAQISALEQSDVFVIGTTNGQVLSMTHLHGQAVSEKRSRSHHQMEIPASGF